MGHMNNGYFMAMLRNDRACLLWHCSIDHIILSKTKPAVRHQDFVVVSNSS